MEIQNKAHQSRGSRNHYIPLEKSQNLHKFNCQHCMFLTVVTKAASMVKRKCMNKRDVMVTERKLDDDSTTAKEIVCCPVAAWHLVVFFRSNYLV